MKRILLSFALSVAAGPALSLSCMPVDVASSYQEADASGKSYVIVHGKLEFDEGKLPKVDIARQDQTPPETDIPARLSGKSLTKSGFSAAFDQPITLRVSCLGPWCGGAATDTDYLSFLERTETGFVLQVTPCGGFDFSEPTRAMVDTVTRCHQGKSCRN
ncbi:hypothetical protein AAFO92_02275 [Roseovarius sp. CAU 1744]|uniref:hypothetical protein n=1 Tax=Roseovarius sp. CAU 1744 TaxID=3140368 RepID=UPI00325BE778